MCPYSRLFVYERVCVVVCVQIVYLRPDKLIEVGSDVEADPIYGSGQRDPTKEQDKQHEVGIGGREIHHLREREREQLVFSIQMNIDFYSVKPKNYK